MKFCRFFIVHSVVRAGGTRLHPGTPRVVLARKTSWKSTPVGRFTPIETDLFFTCAWAGLGSSVGWLGQSRNPDGATY